MQEKIKVVFAKIRSIVSTGADWFDIASLVTFVVLSLLAFCIAVVTLLFWTVKLISFVPIIGITLVTLIVLLFLRASWNLWLELYDNDILSIRNLVLAHLGVGVATVGDWVTKLFGKVK